MTQKEIANAHIRELLRRLLIIENQESKTQRFTKSGRKIQRAICIEIIRRTGEPTDLSTIDAMLNFE